MTEAWLSRQDLYDKIRIRRPPLDGLDILLSNELIQPDICPISPEFSYQNLHLIDWARR
jgi:hypothetical protein